MGAVLRQHAVLAIDHWDEINPSPTCLDHGKQNVMEIVAFDKESEDAFMRGYPAPHRLPQASDVNECGVPPRAPEDHDGNHWATVPDVVVAHPGKTPKHEWNKSYRILKYRLHWALVLAVDGSRRRLHSTSGEEIESLLPGTARPMVPLIKQMCLNINSWVSELTDIPPATTSAASRHGPPTREPCIPVNAAIGGQVVCRV